MLRLRVAAAVLVVAGACGRTTPVELRTAAETTSAVVPADVPRPEGRSLPTTTTTAPPTTTTSAPPPPPATTTTAAPVQTLRASPAPPPVATGGGYGDPSLDETWDRLAGCESGGNWAIDTGNGYYGGIQFSLGSWEAVGGTGYPHQHSREEQIHRGRLLWAQGGWGHWPACSSQLGYR